MFISSLESAPVDVLLVICEYLASGDDKGSLLVFSLVSKACWFVGKAFSLPEDSHSGVEP